MAARSPWERQVDLTITIFRPRIVVHGVLVRRSACHTYMRHADSKALV